MAGILLRNPLRLLREKLETAQKERIEIDAEIDALSVEKAAIYQMIVVIADRIREVDTAIQVFRDDEATYTDAITEFEEAYGSILGLRQQPKGMKEGQYDVIISGRKLGIKLKDNGGKLPTVVKTNQDFPRLKDTLLSVDGDDLSEYERPYAAAMHLIQQCDPQIKPITLRFASFMDHKLKRVHHSHPRPGGLGPTLPGSKLPPKPAPPHRPQKLGSEPPLLGSRLPPKPTPPHRQQKLDSEPPLLGSKLQPKPTPPQRTQKPHWEQPKSVGNSEMQKFADPQTITKANEPSSLKPPRLPPPPKIEPPTTNPTSLPPKSTSNMNSPNFSPAISEAPMNPPDFSLPKPATPVDITNFLIPPPPAAPINLSDFSPKGPTAPGPTS